jgi:hypothetical protein
MKSALMCYSSISSDSDPQSFEVLQFVIQLQTSVEFGEDQQMKKSPRNTHNKLFGKKDVVFRQAACRNSQYRESSKL